MAALNPDTWTYYFTRERPGPAGAKLGAYHGAEIPYVFNSHDSWLPMAKRDRELSKEMMAYWVNFAASGNPNTPYKSQYHDFEARALPVWPPAGSGKVQVLGDTIKSIAPPEPALCELFIEAMLK